METNDQIITLDQVIIMLLFNQNLGHIWASPGEEIFYLWTVLPFGLRCSGYYFCKILRPVIEHCRQKGLRIVSFIDDLCLVSSEQLIQSH